MEFRILGPLEVIEDGQTVDLGGQKQRALLAVLLLHADEVVSTDVLIDALWPERPPDTAAKALQVYVSQLRKSLGKVRLKTKAPGYQLQVGDDAFDLSRVRRLVEEGRPSEALAQWRGPPLSDFAYDPFAQPEIARLEELRLVCLEDRVEQDLAAGRHGALVGELERLVVDHPLRERFRAQLMLALYRADRQAEALEVYQSGRRLLADELGLEPGATLKDLQKAILAHDPSLDATPRPGEPERRPTDEPAAGGSVRREARKIVTVFVAVLQPADGEESLDPEAQRRLARAAFTEIRTAVERHGGTVESVSGDTLITVFGVPAVHEDDALRAVRAAADVAERIHGPRDEFEGSWADSLGARLGLSTGEVVTGGADEELQSTGMPLRTAARLAQAAGPGETILDEATHRLVKDFVHVEARAEGLAVLAVRTDPLVARSRFDAPMVGRRRERRRLHDAFEQAVGDRSCQLFTILGNAGVGKSRLVREFLGEFGDQAAVVRGRCLPYGEGITYFPLMEAVRDAAGFDDDDSPEEGLTKIAALLGEEDDEASLTARRIGELIGLAEVGSGPQESFSAVRALFEAMSRRSPLVIVFDDVHWGEQTFLDLVEHLADWIRDASVLIVAVARPELLDVRAGWSGGKLNATSVLLEPLSVEESTELVESLSGPDLPAATRGRIVAAADGNPLFVEEMLTFALESGLPPGDVEIPPTIHALLAARLDRLGDDERAVIERAAVQGKEFYVDALAAFAPEPLRREVPAVLGSLARKGLVGPDRAGLGGKAHRFRHLLIRDAAYDSIPKQARAGLHEEFAGWLEGAAGERLAEYEEVVGYHYEQAYRYRAELGSDDMHTRELGTRGAERLGAAGQRALMRSDAPAGSNLISRAVALLRPEDRLRVALIPNVRKIQGMTGELVWADRALTEAVEAAATTGDRSLAAHALVQRAFLRLFTRSDATAEELMGIAQRAIGVFDEFGDQLGLARAWRLVAQAHYLDKKAAACVEASQRAFAYACESGDGFEKREVVEWLLVAHEFGPTPAQDAIDALQKLMTRIRPDPLLEGLVSSTIALFEAMRGHVDRAEQLLAEGRNMIEDQTELIPLLLWNTGLIRLGVGQEFDLAEAELRNGYETLSAMGRTGHFSAFCVLLAQVCYETGRYEEASSYVREAAAAARPNDVHDQVSWRATEAKLLARAGRTAEAEQLAREGVALAEEGDFLLSHSEALSALSEVLRLAGRPNDAQVPLEEALSLHERKGNVVAVAQTRKRLDAL